MSDLQVFPVALVGGLHDSKPDPEPTDFRRLENVALLRGRFALRAPVFRVAKLKDDQSPAKAITSVLYIVFHDASMFVVGHSTFTSKVYLYQLNTEGAGTTTPLAVVHTGVATAPRIVAVSFEGGSAGAGVKRLYIADYDEQLDTKIWNGASITTLQEDLDNSGAKENLRFHHMIAFQHHLWGAGFYAGTTLRKELLRFSRPGLIPETEENTPGGTNPREFFSVDWRPVGTRGDKITTLGVTTGGMIVCKRREVYALYGFDALNWAIRPLGSGVGGVGPYAMSWTGAGRGYAMSERGPWVTDGERVEEISELVRKRILEMANVDKHISMYSPDDGINYFVYAKAPSTDPNFYLAWDDANGRYIGEGQWLDSPVVLQDTFTDPDTTLLSAHTPDEPGNTTYTTAGAEPPDILTNRARFRGNQTAFSDHAKTGPLKNGELDLRVYADVERVSTTGTLALTFQVHANSANHEGLELYLEFTGGNVTIRAVRRDTGTNAVENVVIATFAFAGGAQLRFGMDLVDRFATYWTEPYGGGARTVRGSHTFAVSHSDSSHRHLTVATSTSIGAGIQDIARVDNLTVQLLVDQAILPSQGVAIPSVALPAPAGAPTSLAATAASESKIDFSWVNGDNALDTETFVEYSTDAGFASGVVVLGPFSSGVTSSSVTGLVSKTTYYFRARHRRNGQFSSYSAAANAKTWLAPPTNMSAQSITGGVRVTLTNNESGADIQIERRLQGAGTFTALTTLAAQSTGVKTHDDTTGVGGSFYEYRARVSKAGETTSVYTNIVLGFFGQPVSIDDIVIRTVGPNPSLPCQLRVNVEWVASGTFTGVTFKIYQKIATGPFALKATVPGSLSGSYTDNWDSVSEGGGSPTDLTYKIEAIKDGQVISSREETESINVSTCTEL